MSAATVVPATRPARDKVGELLALVGRNVCYQCDWYDRPDSGRRGIGKCTYNPEVQQKRPTDRCSKFALSDEGKARVAAKAKAETEAKAEADKPTPAPKPTGRSPGRPKAPPSEVPVRKPPGWA